MTEGQMVFLFCVIYSGALSVVIWVNMVTRQRVKAHLADPEYAVQSSDNFQQGA